MDYLSEFVLLQLCGTNIPSDILYGIWDRVQPDSPFVRVLVIAESDFNLLDDGAKKFLAIRFMQYVKEEVMFCRDGDPENGESRWFLGNPREFIKAGGKIIFAHGLAIWMKDEENRVQTVSEPVSEPASEPETPKTKTVKIPRPPNAYILYRKDRHNIVKDARPGITNNEISQVLGRAWNLESREVRQKYKEMAEKIKQDLLEKYPDYQYRPRKASEKKRRARRGTETQSSNGGPAITTNNSSPANASPSATASASASA